MSSLEINQLTLESCQKLLQPRSPTAHKGNFGHVLIVGGDYGMQGAVRLTGEAALRSGAGLVSVATRLEHAFAISGNCPELMAKGVKKPKDVEPLLQRADVLALGPGLGKEAWGRNLYYSLINAKLPIVMDADGLNLLSEKPLKNDHWVLTPHVQEAARLLGVSTSFIEADRASAIYSLQNKFGGTIVLKGKGSLILGTEGKLSICHDGNPGMATAGMGDLLTGIIAGLMGQGFSSYQAASLAVCVHAKAGDLVAAQGQRGIKASDLLVNIRQCLNP